MLTKTKERLFDEYCRLDVGRCAFRASCKRSCRSSTLFEPTSVWHIGDDYEATQIRIVFAGKTSRKPDQEQKWCGVRDTTKSGLRFFAEAWPFWSYTKEIATRIHGPEHGVARIAITNMVKCSNSQEGDRTTHVMKQNCMVELGVFAAELATLNPTHVICYAGSYYDDYIHEGLKKLATDKGWDKPVELTARDATFDAGPGNRKMWKWDLQLCNKGKEKMRVLVTSHPQGQVREYFVANLVDWIRLAQHFT